MGLELTPRRESLFDPTGPTTENMIAPMTGVWRDACLFVLHLRRSNGMNALEQVLVDIWHRRLPTRLDAPRVCRGTDSDPHGETSITSMLGLRRVLKELDRILELAPDHLDALSAKGTFLVRLPTLLDEDKQRGEHILQDVVRRDPTSVNARLSSQKATAAEAGTMKRSHLPRIRSTWLICNTAKPH